MLSVNPLNPLAMLFLTHSVMIITITKVSDDNDALYLKTALKIRL